MSDLLFIVLLLACFAGVQPLELLPSLGRAWGWANVFFAGVQPLELLPSLGRGWGWAGVFFAGVQPLELLPSLGRGWGWAGVFFLLVCSPLSSSPPLGGAGGGPMCWLVGGWQVCLALEKLVVSNIFLKFAA